VSAPHDDGPDVPTANTTSAFTPASSRPRSVRVQITRPDRSTCWPRWRNKSIKETMLRLLRFRELPDPKSVSVESDRVPLKIYLGGWKPVQQTPHPLAAANSGPWDSTSVIPNGSRATSISPSAVNRASEYAPSNPAVAYADRSNWIRHLI